MIERLTKESYALKGPFWIVCEIDKDNNLIVENVISYPIVLSQITPSHETIWNSCRGNNKRKWNYYPRGRVEIRRNKAIVFANSLCFEYENLSERIKEIFHLENLTLELKVDNSYHYTNGVFEEN